MRQTIDRLRQFEIATDPAHPIHPRICDEAAEIIELLAAKRFIYQTALEMIADGCKDGSGVAARALELGTWPNEQDLLQPPMTDAGGIVDKRGMPIECRDYEASAATGIQIGVRGHKVWVCIDGAAVLRIRTPEVHLDDQRT